MDIIAKLVLVGLVALVGYFIRAKNLKRVARMDEEGACLSCASTNVDVRGERAHCLDCGFEFGADRGGALTARELDALKGDGMG